MIIDQPVAHPEMGAWYDPTTGEYCCLRHQIAVEQADTFAQLIDTTTWHGLNNPESENDGTPT